MIQTREMMKNVPWPVILNIVLLNLLNVVVGTRKVHPLNVLPHKVAQKTQDSKDKRLEPEDGASI